MEMNARKVVLVTGASGFLGQHIVRELQNEGVDEIRVFDCRPYEQNLGMQLTALTDYHKLIIMNIHEH